MLAVAAICCGVGMRRDEDEGAEFVVGLAGGLAGGLATGLGPPSRPQ